MALAHLHHEQLQGFILGFIISDPLTHQLAQARVSLCQESRVIF